MATVVTNDMLSAVDGRLRKFMFETNATIPLIADKIIKSKTTERRYEILNRVVGVGEAGVVDEGASFPSKDLKQDTSKTISMKKFGFTMNITRELILDNMFDSIADDVSKAMKNSMLQTKERRQINLYNNGFTASTGTLSQDGLSVFNTAHILAQGGTQSNRAAVAGALDLDTFWDGRNTMRTTVGNSGLYDAIYDAKYLVVPQALERRANEIIKSEWTPQSTENSVNVASTLDIKVLTSPLLTSTTAWFLVAEPSDVMEYAFILFNREPMNINNLYNVQGSSELGSNIDRDVYSWRVRERYECDAQTWYGVYGNAGA